MGLCGLPAPTRPRACPPRCSQACGPQTHWCRGGCGGQWRGAWLGRDPKTKKTHVGPALLHALSSGPNPFGFPFYSNSVSGGLGVTGQRHTPTSHAGRPPRRHRSGRAAAPAVPSHRGASRPQGPATAEHGGHTEQDGGGPSCQEAITLPPHGGGVGWGGGSPGACVPPGGLEHAGQCMRFSHAQGPRGVYSGPHVLAEAVPGGGHPPVWSQIPAQRDGPGGGKGRASGVGAPRSVTARPAAGPWPSLSPGLAPPGRTAHTAHKARSTLRRPRPHFTGRETEAAGTASYSPHPPGVAPAGSACAPSGASRSSGRSA